MEEREGSTVQKLGRGQGTAKRGFPLCSVSLRLSSLRSVHQSHKETHAWRLPSQLILGLHGSGGTVQWLVPPFLRSPPTVPFVTLPWASCFLPYVPRAPVRTLPFTRLHWEQTVSPSELNKVRGTQDEQ